MTKREKAKTNHVPQNKLPDHYGALKCVKVTDVDHLLMIVDELGDELGDKMNKPPSPSGNVCPPKGFYWNRAWIIDAYKQGCLFGLQVDESYAMFEDKDSRTNPVFMKRRAAWPFEIDVDHCDASYSLPAFAVVENKAGGKECSMLWVAERARGYGFGSSMVDECGVTHASDVLVESTEFWTRLGFQVDRENKRDRAYVRDEAPSKKTKL
tara:strand:- start:477 stop:1106 length:630 start_codon:yes stop_codon:yes gene_type:complete